MALTLGTNVGFVTTAPTADPAGSDTTIDGSSVVVKDTSPAGSVRITEIGWYRGTGTSDTNYEVALYSESGGVADARLFVDATNSPGTTTGWKTVAVDWTISASTAYWIGLQMDSHLGSSTVDSATSGGSGSDIRTSQSTLNDPYGGGAVADADGMYAIYALVEINFSPTVALNSPADASSDSDTTPTLDFTGTDADGDSISYQLQIDTVSSFDSQAGSPLLNKLSYGSPTTDTFTADDTWTAPAVESVDVAVWGAGGAGGTGSDGGGGGGGGAYSASTVSVTPTTGYTIQVGVGGTGTGAGEDSFFNDSSTVMAKGGSGGGTGGTGAAGGAAGSGVGDTKFSGGTGGSGGDNSGGGGGGSAGATGAGGTGAVGNGGNGGAGGAAGAGGGAVGGAGGDDGLAGNAGNTPGSAGGGAGQGSSTSGGGARGEVRITYVPPGDDGFVNPDTGGDLNPFNSGENIQFTVQAGDALAANTYYWRVRGIDPAGTNTFGAWSSTRSFTVTGGGSTPRTRGFMTTNTGFW